MTPFFRQAVFNPADKRVTIPSRRLLLPLLAVPLVRFFVEPSKPRHSLAGKRKPLVLIRRVSRRLSPWELKQRAFRLERQAKHASPPRKHRLLEKARLCRTLALSNVRRKPSALSLLGLKRPLGSRLIVARL